MLLLFIDHLRFSTSFCSAAFLTLPFFMPSFSISPAMVSSIFIGLLSAATSLGEPSAKANHLFIQRWKLSLQMQHLGHVVDYDVRLVRMQGQIVLMIPFGWIELL